MRPEQNTTILTDHSITVAAAVLAGGAGTRIGGFKAESTLGGRPMVEYPIESLRHAGLDPFVVAKDGNRLDLTGTRLVVEPDQPLHPLLGIATAIREAAGRPVLVVACDLPFLPAGLLYRLAVEPGGTVAASDRGELQPLVARYGPDSLGTIESALAAGDPVKTALDRLRPVAVEVSGTQGFGDPSIILHNVNSMRDLEQAEELLASF